MKQELSLNTAAPQRIPKRNGNRLTFWCFCVITHNTNAHLPPTPLSKYSGRGKVNNHHHTEQYWKNVKQSKVQFSSFMPIIFVTTELTEKSLVKGREAEHVLPSGPACGASWVNADSGKNLFLRRNSFWGCPRWLRAQLNSCSDQNAPVKDPALTWCLAARLAAVPPSCWWGKASGTVLVNLHYPVGKPSLRITIILNYWLQSKQQQVTFL